MNEMKGKSKEREKERLNKELRTLRQKNGKKG